MLFITFRCDLYLDLFCENLETDSNYCFSEYDISKLTKIESGFIMSIQQALIDEIELLLRYNLDSTQGGIKVHHTAREELVEAIKRLHEKGLVTEEDGGYLTDLGHEAAEHTQAALRILTSKS